MENRAKEWCHVIAKGRGRLYARAEVLLSILIKMSVGWAWVCAA